jgi:hypothetical protein
MFNHVFIYNTAGERKDKILQGVLRLQYFWVQNQLTLCIHTNIFGEN